MPHHTIASLRRVVGPLFSTPGRADGVRFWTLNLTLFGFRDALESSYVSNGADRILERCAEVKAVRPELENRLVGKAPLLHYSAQFVLGYAMIAKASRQTGSGYGTGATDSDSDSDCILK